MRLRDNSRHRRPRAPLPRWLRLGLGGLWLLDTVLQAQPGMFTMAMISGVMQPTAQGQPPWIAAALNWAIRLITPHVAIWNLGFIAIQAVIAALLLSRRPGLNRGGLWLSLGWSAALWIFGEGLGGILTGSASFIVGAPGSAALYGLAAALVLAGWGRGGPEVLPHARQSVAVIFVLSALAQTAPVFWTPLGLSSMFQGTLMMQPPWLAATIAPVVAATARQPVLFNAVFIVVLAASAAGLWWRRPWAYALATAWLVFVWWAGQGFGMLLTGMGTDPNTPPLVGLLLLAGAAPNRETVPPMRG